MALSPEQIAFVKEERLKMIAHITAPIDDDVMRDTINEVWAAHGCKPQTIRIFDCPVEAGKVFKKTAGDQNSKLVKGVVDSFIKASTETVIEVIGHDAEKETIDNVKATLAGELRKEFHAGVIHENQSNNTTNTFFNVMLRVDAAVKEIAPAKPLDDEFLCPGYMYTYSVYFAICQKYGLFVPNAASQLFDKFTRNIHTVFIDCDNPIIVRPPVLMIHNDLFMGNETGPAYAYKDGLKMWILDDMAVDEQLVMRPETQTIKQIEDEENADIKSIRITRYTWLRYLREIGAKEIDMFENDVEGTIEALYELKDKTKRFAVSCPTGRPFVMGVDSAVKTCAEARAWLPGDVSVNIIGAT